MFKYRYILSLCFIFIFSLNTLAQSGEIEETIEKTSQPNDDEAPSEKQELSEWEKRLEGIS